MLPMREFIVVGAASIIGSNPVPPNGLAVSLDIDLFPPPDGTAEITKTVTMHFGEGSEFQEENGFYIESVGLWTMLTALPGWKERLIRVKTPNGVVGLCLSPLDIAFVKLDAGRDKDIEYVGIMLRAEIVSRRELKEAIDSRDPEMRVRLEDALSKAAQSSR